MKINFLLLIFAGLLVASCKKPETKPKTNATGPTNPFTTVNSFFLKKDGIAFNPAYLEVSDPFEYAVSVYAAATTQSNADVYSMMINKDIPVGTYDYETLVEEYGCWFSYSSPNLELYAINDGTFQITNQNTSAGILEMKFQFELEDPNTGQTYQVTEGKFKVYY
ncbi:hypothetical protein [Fluviicola sp.]|uniref:hypothetical protein n=1 Tax=Fluviicola sp. TaxID=1917219 RepID=UPI0031D20E9B